MHWEKFDRLLSFPIHVLWTLAFKEMGQQKINETNTTKTVLQNWDCYLLAEMYFLCVYVLVCLFVDKQLAQMETKCYKLTIFNYAQTTSLVIAQCYATQKVDHTKENTGNVILWAN